MSYLLFPGRHHLLTCFQSQYLTEVISGTDLVDVNGQPWEQSTPVDAIIWAVTSANHWNTRRNPLPANRREVAIEQFSRQLDAQSFVYLIDDIGTTSRFAEYVLKKIHVDSQGRFQLTPENTVVGCSTPAVIQMYERLGFRILPFELMDRETETLRADTPWQILESMIAAALDGDDWRTTPAFVSQVDRASRQLYLKYDFGEQILRLFHSPLLTDDGDLTESRDYNTYVRSFDRGARRKYDLVCDHVAPGRIVDIGCCTGALIRELTRDTRFHESDFVGIEVARQLYTECLHRKEQGDFANDHVFFYQKDFAAGPIFPENSVNTFTTFSITHEIESYAGRDALERFLDLLYSQLVIGGRWINVDVVGPAAGNELVDMRLNWTDGRSDDFDRQFDIDDREALRSYLDGLSTGARFLRFAQDFRRDEGELLSYETRDVDGDTLFRLSLADACEFMSKKDYTDNWVSEMHERFCFWDEGQWRQAAERHGFRLLPATRAFTNAWIVENRYRGKVALLRESHGQWETLDCPVTNMLLVAERR